MSFTTGSIPQERYYNGNVFPLTLDWTSTETDSSLLSEWFSHNKELIDSQLREHKAILFRCGKTAPSYLEFSSIVEAIDYSGMDYIGGAAVRTQLTSKVFTANESPSSEPIPFHHEMAQTPNPPTHLFFYCESPPDRGGETPILVSAEVCSRLQERHPLFVADLEARGVNYVRVMPEQDDPSSAIGRGWKSTFNTDNRGECILLYRFVSYDALFR